MGRELDLRRCSLLELAVARTGSMIGGAKVAAFVWAWGQVRDELGRNPSMEEYAAYWREGRSTAYRHQAAFREVFPGLEDPGPVIKHYERHRARPDARLDLAAVA